MRMLSETKALSDLQKLKNDYRDFVKTNYEPRAKNCSTCETRGACCLDAHFVNVHITRLEAVAVRKTLANLTAERQAEIYNRAAETVEKYDLKSSGDTFQKTYACPLFERSVGCLVHESGKPAPCISHGCYENKKDLPPESLQDDVEKKIERLNEKTYRSVSSRLPLPVWLINTKAETRP